MKRKGIFITLEGPEGSGKSSQGRNLVSYLKKSGFKVVFVHDPGSTSLGKELRNVLLHKTYKIAPLTEALLFIGARAQLVKEKILPALRDGKLVVCDRFHDATMAYQGFGGGVNLIWLNRFGLEAINNVMPSLTILLDLPVGRGFSRLNRKHDRMEQKAIAFHKKVRAGYRLLARKAPRRIKVINAAQPINRVKEDIEVAVKHHITHTRK